VRVWIGRVVLAAALLLLAGCQLDVTVELDVEQDGSGTVAVLAKFDDEANAKLGDLGEQLRIADMERAGWDVAIVDFDDDATLVTATKEVGARDQWQSVLDEIAGPDVFRNASVVADDSFANTSQRLSFDLDLSESWDLAADDEFTAVLGEPFGAPILWLASSRSIDSIVSVEVLATVVDSDQGTPASDRFTHRFDSQLPRQASVVATTENPTAILLRWISMALFALFALATVLAVTGIILQRRSERLRPAPTPSSLASRLPNRRTEVIAAQPPAGRAAAGDSVQLIVFEPLALFYDQGDPFANEVLPFIRSQGSDARADTIDQAYRGLLVGEMDSHAFWQRCGLDPDEMDGRFVAERSLQSGVGALLKDMQRRGIALAAVTDDAAVWSDEVRDRDRLAGVDPWLVSSELGATKDTLGVFERVRRDSRIAYRHWLYIDTSIGALDAASELGMKTALFDTGDVALPEVVVHPIMTDLSELVGRKGAARLGLDPRS